MALTVTTDLTNITTAESDTGWVDIGSGGSAALEPDFYVQGSNCESRAVSNSKKGMAFDFGSGIDFTTGTHQDKLVYIWVRVNTPQLADTIRNDGVTIRLSSSSATTNYREWAVDGGNTIPATEGWICYVVDPQSAGTVDNGTYVATGVQFFGAVVDMTTTAKGQNIGIDRIMYGRGEIYVSGTVATAGEGFKEIAAVAYDAALTNRWGIITIKQGIIYVKGKIIIGHATANTTFSSYGETVVFETGYYDNNTNVVKLVPDAGVGAVTGADGLTSYNGLAFTGGSGATDIDIGLIVGTDSGRSGSTFICPDQSLLTTPAKTLATISVDNATMSLDMYGTTFKGFEGIVDLKGTGVNDDDCFSCTFDGCGRITTNMELRNCNIVNSVAAVTDGAMIWDDTMNVQKSLFANNSRAIVFEASTGTPFTFTNLTFANNTFDVRNEIAVTDITIDYGTGALPTKEDVSGSTTTLTGSVPIKITVVDKDNVAIQNAQTACYVGATQVFNTDTDVNGEVNSTYTSALPANAVWYSRKGSTGGTKYIPNSGPVTIAVGTGFDIKVVLLEDTNNAT